MKTTAQATPPEQIEAALLGAFGLYAFYEGVKTEPEHPHTNVYRIDGATGEIALVADDIDHPNGLAFSPDESVLYVVESRSEPRNILAYDVAEGGRALRRQRGREARGIVL